MNLGIANRIIVTNLDEAVEQPYSDAVAAFQLADDVSCPYVATALDGMGETLLMQAACTEPDISVYVVDDPSCVTLDEGDWEEAAPDSDEMGYGQSDWDAHTDPMQDACIPFGNTEAW